MNEEQFLPYAKSRYDQEYQRHHNIDSKAYNIIGFVGVIIAIFSVISDGIIQNNGFILTGLGILLLSIIVALISLYPKKNIPTINAEKFRLKIQNNEKIPSLTKVYSQHARLFDWQNTQKVKKVKCSLIIMIIGLTVTFLSTILSIV